MQLCTPDSHKQTALHPVWAEESYPNKRVTAHCSNRDGMSVHEHVVAMMCLHELSTDNRKVRDVDFDVTGRESIDRP